MIEPDVGQVKYIPKPALLKTVGAMVAAPHPPFFSFAGEQAIRAIEYFGLTYALVGRATIYSRFNQQSLTLPTLCMQESGGKLGFGGAQKFSSS